MCVSVCNATLPHTLTDSLNAHSVSVGSRCLCPDTAIRCAGGFWLQLAALCVHMHALNALCVCPAYPLSNNVGVAQHQPLDYNAHSRVLYMYSTGGIIMHTHDICARRSRLELKQRTHEMDISAHADRPISLSQNRECGMRMNGADGNDNGWVDVLGCALFGINVCLCVFVSSNVWHDDGVQFQEDTRRFAASPKHAWTESDIMRMFSDSPEVPEQNTFWGERA